MFPILNFIFHSWNEPQNTRHKLITEQGMVIKVVQPVSYFQTFEAFESEHGIVGNEQLS